MKKKILGIIIPVVGAIICGYICGKYVYSVYKDNVYGDLRSSKIYLVQNGKYDSYDNMREENNGNNYVYYHVDKIKKLYSNKLEVYEYYVPVNYVNNKQDEYDKVLSDTDDIHQVKEVVDNILNLYRNDDSIKLISIS